MITDIIFNCYRGPGCFSKEQDEIRVYVLVVNMSVECFYYYTAIFDSGFNLLFHLHGIFLIRLLLDLEMTHKVFQLLWFQCW